MTALLDEDTARAHRSRNAAQSLLIILSIGLLLALAGTIAWGLSGALVALAAVGGIAILTPRIPAEAIMRLYRARLLPPDDSQLSSLVDVLAFRAGLARRPSLFVIPSNAMNAFSTGPANRPAIAVTEGLLRRLTLRETAGVLAHEVAHIKNGDLEVMGLADVVTRFLHALAGTALILAAVSLLFGTGGAAVVPWWGLLVLYLAPALSNLLLLALSRAREFDADSEAVALTGDALGLASALRRLESYTGHFWEDLMLPAPGRRVPIPSVLRTHPEPQARIDHLLALENAPQHEPLVIVEQPMVTLVGFGPIAMRPRYRWPGVWY